MTQLSLSHVADKNTEALVSGLCRRGLGLVLQPDHPPGQRPSLWDPHRNRGPLWEVQGRGLLHTGPAQGPGEPEIHIQVTSGPVHALMWASEVAAPP